MTANRQELVDQVQGFASNVADMAMELDITREFVNNLRKILGLCPLGGDEHKNGGYAEINTTVRKLLPEPLTFSVKDQVLAWGTVHNLCCTLGMKDTTNPRDDVHHFIKGLFDEKNRLATQDDTRDKLIETLTTQVEHFGDLLDEALKAWLESEEEWKAAVPDARWPTLALAASKAKIDGFRMRSECRPEPRHMLIARQNAVIESLRTSIADLIEEKLKAFVKQEPAEA